MENLSDYSNYVIAAYMVAGLAIAGFTAIILAKYFFLKKHKNEK